MINDSKPNRKNTPPIKVCCTPLERQTIFEKAEQCGLSASNYLRAIGLGMGVTSVIDHRKVDELVRVNGDLGRLGGLLKLWLSNDEKLRLDNKQLLRNQILDTLAEINNNQTAIKTIIQRVVRS
ncbi:MAG: conjugal transfer protein TraJ [Methylobacter sp.]|nr:conjugal transfer protein TraJ [Methylobacter sp.]